MRRARPGAPPLGVVDRTPAGTEEIREPAGPTAGQARQPEERGASRLWHVTLSVSGPEAPRADVRRALEQLAHEMARGRVREMPPARDNLLDRAWQALTSHLRQATRPHPAAWRGGA